jgi:hypothetical protein
MLGLLVNWTAILGLKRKKVLAHAHAAAAAAAARPSLASV